MKFKTEIDCLRWALGIALQRCTKSQRDNIEWELDKFELEMRMVDGVQKLSKIKQRGINK